MANPINTARTNPLTAGNRPMPNGFQTLIAFQLAPALAFFEKAVTPPGMDGGEPIDITTMWNNRSRTKAPRALIEPTNASMRVGYDMAALDPGVVATTIEDLINDNQMITVHYPDTSQYSFWGWLKTFIPGEMEDGVFPEADMEIVQSNWDDVNCVEADALVTSSDGTC